MTATMKGTYDLGSKQIKSWTLTQNMDTSKTHPPVIDHILLEQPKKTNVALQNIKPSIENLNTTPDPHMSLL